MRLYFAPRSQFARKVRIVLAELALPHEAVNTQARPQEELAALNPNLTIPVLEDGGKRLFDSSVIVAYLLTTYPQRPASGAQPPLAAHLVRPERAWEDTLVLATLETLGYAGMVLRQMDAGGVNADSVPWLQRHQARLCSELAWLEAQATAEGFAPGSFCAADISLICYTDFMERRGLAQMTDYPTLQALRACFAQRPSVRETALPAD